MSRKCSPGEDKKEGVGSENTGKPDQSEGSDSKPGAMPGEPLESTAGDEAADAN